MRWARLRKYRTAPLRRHPARVCYGYARSQPLASVDCRDIFAKHLKHGVYVRNQQLLQDLHSLLFCHL